MTIYNNNIKNDMIKNRLKATIYVTHIHTPEKGPRHRVKVKVRFTYKCHNSPSAVLSSQTGWRIAQAAAQNRNHGLWPVAISLT